jgi:hypothetical protein
MQYIENLLRTSETAPGYSTVTKWLKRFVGGDDILETVERGGKESDTLVDFNILRALTAFPFHSVRTLASSLTIPRSTTYHHLQRELHCETFEVGSPHAG